MSIVTLMTDFGDSAYVGAVKGVIASLCPKATIIDITHSIREFDIRQAAYELNVAAPYFPKGTTHCVVVDPTVGTKRRCIIAEAEDYLFVGPDNGVFTFIDGIENVYELESKGAAPTFHGRDVFAPAAAKLACGEKPRDLGKQGKGVTRIPIRKVTSKAKHVSGEAITVDRFGNIITNIRVEDLEEAGISFGDALALKAMGRTRMVNLLKTYGLAKKGELVCVIGSAGYMEIAVNQGDASALLGMKGGEEVALG